MRHTVKTQMFWEDTNHILRDYLMNTPVPLIFEELLQDPDVFENQVWTDFMHPAPSPRNPTPRTFEKTSLHDFVWEHIFKDLLLKVFRDRLLGSQEDFESYVRRSENYAALFNDMIGGVNCSNDLSDIICRFYEMMKDYLSRNLPSDGKDFSVLRTKEVLAACRESYRARRWRDDAPEEVERTYYIDFESQTFSSALLVQFEDMAEPLESHPKSHHFMVLAEFLQVMFIYIYMVEFMKYYPKRRGDDDLRLTPAEKTGRNLCLFPALATYDYKSLYYKIKAKRDENKKFVKPRS